MKKKFALLFSCCILATGLIALPFSLGQEHYFYPNAINEHYGLEMNSTKNKFHNNTGATAYSGEATVKTDLDNAINFIYTDIMGLASTWHVIKNGGSFYNSSPIHGIESISLSFKTDAKDFKLYWSNSLSFEEEQSQTFVSSTSSSTHFYFNGDNPTYFKFINVSGSNLNISDVELSYSCNNNYPTLTINSENLTMGTVNGSSGIIRSGESASISATPNQGYRFVGWYSGETLISSNSTYVFEMGYEDLNYTARFTYQSYNLVVETESSEKGTVSDVSGNYSYLTSVTVEATSNNGYTFSGWYEGDVLVSSSNPYTFNMPYNDTSYTAKFSTNSYNLTLENENPTLGSISNSNSYLYGSSVTIVATPNTGVSFLGWFDGNDVLVSSLSTYTFNMPHEDLTYTAKFEWTAYSVNVSINNKDMGSITGNGSYIYEQEVTLVATPNEHYSFFGWYDGETLLSRDSTYVFAMPNNSLDYEAKFVPNHNLIISSDNESLGSVSYPNECGEGLEVTIIANANTGYALDYWYDEDLNEVSYDSSYTFIMPDHDVTLYATFTVGYTLTATSSDLSKGTVSGSGQYVAGRNVTVTMNHISGTYRGWYDTNDNLLSTSNSYTFVMPENNYSIEARFLTQEEEEQLEWNKNHGVVPVLSQDGKTISYGLYPQTNINDSALISALDSLENPDSNGWYLYNGDYYAKTNANPDDSGFEFDNGTSISSGTSYWFKCQPIVWNILTNKSGKCYAVSSILLDTCLYYSSNSKRTIDGKTVYPNNYKYSSIRTWLNGDFYNAAFSLDDNYLVETIVNNAASTTGDSNNQYACENTEDKVFLPSYKDYINKSYGFSTDIGESDTRKCKTSDWSRARGAYCLSSGDNQYNGRYWTRSPYNSEYFTWYVREAGNYGAYNLYATNNCIRPAITINIA